MKIIKPIGDSDKVRFRDLLHKIEDRVNAQFPVCSPDILLELASLLGVDSVKEHQLMCVLQSTLESYVDAKYDLTNLLLDLHDPIVALRDLYSQQRELCGKTNTIIICQECDKKSAVLRCEICEDSYCQECFDILHATGNRRTHQCVELEQLVCVICDKQMASSQCIQCGSFFCDVCFQTVHSTGTLLSHRKRTVSGLVCQECEHTHAAIVCEDCVDLFCAQCYAKLHKNGNRTTHSYLAIDANGQLFKQGLLVPTHEAQKLIDHARASLSPWMRFDTDKWEPFWYNFQTDMRTNVCPL